MAAWGPFDPGPASFYQRNPGKSGSLLREEFDKNYLLEYDKHTFVKLYIDKEMTIQTFLRHELNRECLIAVMMAYVAFFLENVYVKGGRAGAFIAVPTSLDPSTWQLHVISGATFLEAVYFCIENHRDNKYVDHILKTGVQECCPS